MSRIVTIRCTCGACPTQYEGTLDDGNAFYFRYRWGFAEVGIAPTHDQAVEATFGGGPHFSRGRQIGGEYAGWMEPEDVHKLLREWIAEYGIQTVTQ